MEARTAIPPTAAPPRSRFRIKSGGLLIIAALVLSGYIALSAHDTAPDVTFVRLDGEQVALEDLRGKVVIVNFWATSCTTCIGEMPQMIATFNRYKDQGLDFVAVAMSHDPPNYVLNYARTRKLPFQVALDPQDTLAKAFGDVRLTPTTFVIDRNGAILKRYVGKLQFAEFHRLLEKALEK